ncbi:MAG: hypothetical protein EA401_08125 [Planctomycetota bacterium]|nr:MAG: hypothetical protein EA401_08125 [Planctomycetota bacterium]
MKMTYALYATCFAACWSISMGDLRAAEPPEREAHTIEQQPIPVTSRNEITIRARDDADVKQRELWYRRRSGDTWADWQRHGITFGRNDAIVWQPPEGHWQISVRIEDISGLATPVPTAETSGQQEFIIDRTPPAVNITFPEDGAFLRGDHTYDITWEVSDPHLHSTPITIRWTRGSDQDYQIIAEHIPNSGSFRWTTPRDMTASGKIQILAWDRALNRGEGDVESLVVDALPPSRNILGPSIVADHQVDLSITARDAGPAGMAWVQLWFSPDNGVTWNEGPRLDEGPWESLSWTAPGDGHYLLDLVAADKSGNRTSLPRNSDDALARIIVDTVAPVVSLDSPIGVRQVTAGSDRTLRRVYKPGDQVRVAFSVQDDNIGPGAATVQLQLEPDAPWRNVGESLSASEPFTFPIPDVNTDHARIRVQVTDIAGNRGQVVAEEHFRIRNIVEEGEVEIDLD